MQCVVQSHFCVIHLANYNNNGHGAKSTYPSESQTSLFSLIPTRSGSDYDRLLRPSKTRLIAMFALRELKVASQPGKRRKSGPKSRQWNRMF